MRSFALLASCLALVTLGCGDAGDATDPADPAVPAAAASTAELMIKGARIVPAGGVAALYVTVEAPEGDRLVGASSTAGGQIELHETVLDGDMVRMQARPDGFKLAPGEAFELRPGGPHAMWMGRDFEAGERVPLVLHFEAAGDVATTALVEAMGGGAPPGAGDHSNHGEHGGHPEHDGLQQDRPAGDGDHGDPGNADAEQPAPAEGHSP